jgi:hypothetical protein
MESEIEGHQLIVLSLTEAHLATSDTLKPEGPLISKLDVGFLGLIIFSGTNSNKHFQWMFLSP